MRAAALDAPDIVVLGPSSGSRLLGFVVACAAKFGRGPKIISWDAFLRDHCVLAEALSERAYLRFESPDQDFAALEALYAEGEERARAAKVATLNADDLQCLRRGAIGSPTQLWFGLYGAMVAAVCIAASKGAVVSLTPDLAGLVFDKTACQQHLNAAHIPIPRRLPPPASFEALIESMRAERAPRVFIKLRHGAAAAGMMALARNGDEWLAWTTSVLGADGRLYATRNVRRLTDWREIAPLVDRLSALQLHVEQWIPKFGIGQDSIDLRIVMVDGEPIPIVRGSRHPITNLHIGGSRHAPEDLITRIGASSWQGVLEIASAAAASLRGGDMLAFDVALRACGRKGVVLEVNAFGDYIKGMTLDPHRAVVDCIARRMKTRLSVGALA